MNQDLIYGKNPLERVVSVEVADGTAEIFIENPDGSVTSEFMPHNFWLLYSNNMNPKFKRLDGDQHFKYMIEYPTYAKYREIIQSSYKKRYLFYTAHDPKTNFMIRSGVTQFKGMKIEDVSVLSFDIETAGLNPQASDAQVLIISNTARRNGKTVRKMFSRDEYANDADMIEDWFHWVRKVNPSIMIGHNILGFDLPYLQARGGKLMLGRDDSIMQIQDRVRQFRKDGSQTYDYNDILIYGREIIDTKFLSIKYDVNRDFPNYSLKPMIEHLGLQKKNRTFVDASKMKQLWADPKMRETIKAYAMDDSDDALKLYDLMMPSFFYYMQNIPMSAQQINNSATGAQINSFMVRAYLQDGHSIPKPCDIEPFRGAISLGVPGVHKNTVKLDIKSNYPNIMLQFDVFPNDKDPKGYMREALEYFLASRSKNKDLAKSTGDTYFEALSNAGKIVANSYYGFMGAPGCNFNYPEGAARVTAIGRDILRSAIYWATGKEVELGVSEDSEDIEFHAS